MWTYVLLSIYSVVIIGTSLLGGWLPSLLHLRQRNMQLLTCLVAGLMLGVAVLHLMPHSFAETQTIDATALWIMAGVLVMWALVRLFHFHQHVVVDEKGNVEAVNCQHEHVHGDIAADTHQHDHSHSPATTGKYNWLGVAFGLGLHTLIDGVALGAAVHSEAAHGHAFPIYGLGVFLAVALHKPMDALAVTALMHAGGWSWRSQSLVNLAFAIMAPIGAFLVVAGTGIAGQQSFVLGCALAFSCGVFLWIALGDLLPDVHFHSGDRSKFAAALLIGVLIAWGIGFLEPPHAHAPHHNGSGHSHGHGHSQKHNEHSQKHNEHSQEHGEHSQQHGHSHGHGH